MTVGGQPVPTSAWYPESIRFVMPSFPNTSSVSVVVRTADHARANELFLAVKQTP